MTQEFLRKKFREFLEQYGIFDIFCDDLKCPFDFLAIDEFSIVSQVRITIQNGFFWREVSDLWEAKYKELIESEEPTETQQSSILKHLQDGKSITALDALQLFGCFRLSGRIFDLRKLGYNIVSTTVNNGKKSFTSYTIQT